MSSSEMKWTAKSEKKTAILSEAGASTENLTRGLNLRARLARILRHPFLMPYNRWILAVVLANGLIWQYFFNAESVSSDFNRTLTLVFVNFSAAILIRQQDVINFLFRVATSLPHRWPLAIRWAAGKVYHFGGIHVGAYFSGSLWMIYASWLATRGGAPVRPSWLPALLIAHSVLLMLIMVVALPPIRSRFHNAFEKTARFGNWLSLLLFWVQSLAIAVHSNEVGFVPFFSSWQFLVLLILTALTSLPWLRMRKVPVRWIRPSRHAVFAIFDYGITPFAGSSTDLSLDPLLEWHSFANVPIPGQNGFQLTISRAGDWTGKLIDQLPSHIWVRGIPTAGVGNIEKLFRKVLWVATGSGIGPCLPHLLENKIPSQLVWSTRDPIANYGKDLVRKIEEVQPDAVIWNTDAAGKPQLFELALRAFRESGAEAVICISNKKVTWDIVYEFESRGIPAFGAIWDS